MKRTGLLPVLFLCLQTLHAVSIRVYTTQANGTQRLEYNTLKPSLVIGANYIQLLPETQYQDMDGFGYAVTYSSCYNLMRMNPLDRRAFLRRTYDKKTGLGVSYARISIGCSDFSSTEYSLCDTKGLENFRLYTDETKFVIPILKEILEINPDLKIMAAPWTCPKWMKIKSLSEPVPYDSWTSGTLNPAYYQTYADYFVKFIQAFQSEGIPIYAVTPQNEPLNRGNSASLYLPWSEEAALIGKMAPAFKRAGLKTKIYCFDHNWNYDNIADQQDYPIKLYNALDGTMEGSELVVGSAWHDYGGSPSELDDINAKAPDKEVIFTEASIGTWNDGRNLNARLLSDMKQLVYSTVTRQCKAVMVWNLMLDNKMGPNRDGGCKTCYGAVDIDQNDYHTISANSHYYILAHASAVVRPGAVRIGTQSSSIQGVYHVAFRNPDGSFGVLMVNESTVSKVVAVYERSGQKVRVPLPARSLVSVLIGAEEERIPAIGTQEFTRTEMGVYSTSMDLVQGEEYMQNFLLDQENWYVDPDYFYVREDGMMAFRPLSGRYVVTVDVNGRYVTVRPDGQETVYAAGPAHSVGKPYYYYGTTSSETSVLPMAEIEKGLYQITFFVGEQMTTTDVDFAFYTSSDMGTKFLGSGSEHKLTYQTSPSTYTFNLGQGKNGHQDGHIYSIGTALKLRVGVPYTAIVDLRQGTADGLVYVQKYNPLTDGIGMTGKWNVPTEEAFYDLTGRRLARQPRKGLYIRNGRINTNQTW